MKLTDPYNIWNFSALIMLIIVCRREAVIFKGGGGLLKG